MSRKSGNRFSDKDMRKLKNLAPVPIDRHAVVALRFLRGDQAVEHIVDDALAIARARIAEAASPRQLQADRVARRHRLSPLRSDRTPRAQRHHARRAGPRALSLASPV